MDLLSISAPLSTHFPTLQTHKSFINPRRKPCALSVRSQLSAPASTAFKSSAPQTLTLGFESEPGFSFSSSFSPSASQAQQMAARAEADPMGMLLKERIVFLGSQIDDLVADAIISQLLLLDAQDPTKDIRLFVNSPGGSLSATMAIYDVVQLVRADVSTVALGISASTASIILGGGTKGKRLAMPNTRIMIHQPLGGASGQAIDVEIQAKEVYVPIEAVEYGIIDGVIDQDSIIPLMPVPDKVKSRVTFEEVRKDPRKFLTPEIPDDEIY
ncbi:unnamed protein product [Rhodiola kirilowii]